MMTLTASSDRVDEKAVKLHGKDKVHAVAFFADGTHIRTADKGGEVRCWRVQDGVPLGTPMNVQDPVCAMAGSQDGRQWIVCGTQRGRVSVWDAESCERVVAFDAHSDWVYAVDVSPDGTRIATGSDDKMASVWALSTGERLLGPWAHDDTVCAIKFSPDGRLLATAAWDRTSVRIYDAARLRLDVPLNVDALENQSFAWTSDSACLYVLSAGGHVARLDASTGALCARWAIHSDRDPTCIALAGDGAVLAASAHATVSFWDARTHAQVGPVVSHTAGVDALAISARGDLAMGGGRTVTVCSLRGILLLETDRERAMKAHVADLEQTIVSLRARGESSDDRLACLEETNQRLRHQLSDSRRRADNLDDTVERLHGKMTDLERQLGVHERKQACETLYAEGRTIDAAACLVELMHAVTGHGPITDWLTQFARRCIVTLEGAGDEASREERYEDAAVAYASALSLGRSTPHALLYKWARTALMRGALDDALRVADAKFTLPEFVTHRTVCHVLEQDGRVSDAIQCFQRIVPESVGERAWMAGFKRRCLETLTRRGDLAMNSASYDDAIVHYTAALALEPSSTDFLTRRSKARAEMQSWQGALEDADAAIQLDPSSPRGYERRRAALLGVCRYDEAIGAYDDMLLKFEQSPDDVARGSRQHYVSPSKTRAVVRHVAKRAQRDAPLVLIDTETGCLRDERGRLDDFEADRTFKELVASMTTAVDHARVARSVEAYFKYGTFSHTWEVAEPLFQDVLGRPVHALAASPTVFKLTMFCAMSREAGLRWAWSDTCCINKADGAVLQESLTSMFQWYHRSALTIVHLKGVFSDSELGALIRCLWNTRAWTLQEFFASRVVRFYTEDWKPYVPDERAYNHKDSPVIMAEMAAATGVDAHVLLSLRPGSENVRQKLCLAAARVATKQEDIAYALFGIFDVSLPVNYGEGEQRALGRLLQEVLTRSGDVTVLAWTGKASEYNSCLPAEIGVYREPASVYVPTWAVEEDETEASVAARRTSSYLDSVVALYDRVVGLPSPRLVSRRLSVSCIKFPLKSLSPLRREGSARRAYRAVTSALGTIEIETTEDLSRVGNLVLVHPWLRCLLDPALPAESPMSGSDGDGTAPLTPLDEDGSSVDALPRAGSCSHDKRARALRFFARLGRPFGALLLAGLSHHEYRRVASESLVVAQLLENVPPRYLVDRTQTLDVL